MDAVRPAYDGDAALARRLADAGSPYDVAGVRALIAGVLAAPPGLEADGWTILVAPDPPAALKAQLLALAALLDQDAEASFPPGAAAERLARLRGEFARLGVDGFLVPRADEHQGEYVPARAQRLAWLTGFTGSAGLAVVLEERAAVFVDGRYTLQAAAQVDASLYDAPPSQRAAGDRVDRGQSRQRARCWATTRGCTRRARSSAIAPPPNGPAGRSGRLPTTRSMPSGPAGRRRRSRRWCRIRCALPARARSTSASDIAAALAKDGVDAAVLTAPNSIAWLLNIRGGDVPHTPLPLAFAVRIATPPSISSSTGASSRRASADHLGADGAVRRARRARRRSTASAPGRQRVAADPASAAAWVFDRLDAAGAQAASRRRSLPVAQGVQEPGRAGGRARGPSPRRRGLDAFPRLARAGGAGGRPHRDRGLRPARSVPPRRREFPRSQLPHHLRRGCQRRHRALPRHPRDRAPARTRHALSRRFRARSISTAPPTSPAPSRSARPAPRCATASPACSRATSRWRSCRFPKGTTGAQLDVAGAPRAVGGRARLRSRHRPRRRQLSRRARGAAAHLQAAVARSRCCRA